MIGGVDSRAVLIRNSILDRSLDDANPGKLTMASPGTGIAQFLAELVFLQMAKNRIIFRVAYSPSSSNYHADRRNRPYISANPCADRPVSARGAFKCEVELCNLVRIFS